MRKLSVRYEEKIVKTTGDPNTANVITTFRDGSSISFQINIDTKFYTDGAPGSDGKKFLRDIVSFTIYEKGYGFKFKDESELIVKVSIPQSILDKSYPK